jgi:flavin reductase (DIM6/NTAB) family NADH-FMN oxidoreductase RutF
MARHVTQAPPERFFGYYPGTVAVVTAQHRGERNVMSAGWHAALSIAPPMYGVAVNFHHATHAPIAASDAFAVHFLPFEHAEAIAGVGSVSRHDGVDKFARFGLETEPGAALELPILQEAYFAYECRLASTTRTGDHDWFAGVLVALHYDEDAFEGWILDSSATEAAIYFGRSRYVGLGPDNRQATLLPQP